MRRARREVLGLAGLGAMAAALAACAPPRPFAAAPAPPTAWPTADAPTWRALNRLTFGPTAAERAHAATIGLPAWIEEQLAPATLPDGDAEWRVRRFDSLRLDPSVIFNVRAENIRRDLQQATLLRAIYSRRQLYEIMVEFWSDHFSISTHKGDCAWLKPLDDATVIRPHALGRFPDLLRASLRSPAMLVYLDNQENHRGRPNENYARELLELHTLGVNGGYAQRDVAEVARALTGWSVDRQRYRGRFRFDAAQHDDGAKRVLGTIIPAGGGERDGERVAAILLAHPSTPRLIARELTRRLVADPPPPALVERAVATFRRTDGDIAATLRTIFGAADFAAAPPLFKRPVHYVAGALRQLGAETDAGPPLLAHLAAMGQPLFQWPTPDGYPSGLAAWQGSLLARWQFALALTTDAIPGTRLDLPGLARAAGLADGTALATALDRLGTLLLGAPPPRPVIDGLVAALGPTLDRTGLGPPLAALLAAPHYQWR